MREVVKTLKDLIPILQESCVYLHCVYMECAMSGLEDTYIDFTFIWVGVSSSYSVKTLQRHSLKMVKSPFPVLVAH